MDTPIICAAISLFFVISLVPSLLLTTICKELTIVSPSTIYETVDLEIDSWADENPVYSYWAKDIFQKHNIGEER